MTDEAKVQRIKERFSQGAYLTFLQRTNTAVGFTCYLVNTSEFWKL
jgi:hypothetical protein